MRLSTLVGDGAVDGTGHGTDQFAVAGGDCRPRHAWRRGVHQAILQSRDPLVV